jgi:hypothetical protein
MEIVRVLALAVATLFIYSPFMSARFMGAGDARQYNCLLSDFLAQNRAGVSPVYLSQSAYGWLGSAIVQRPYYYYLGGLLNVLTGDASSAVVLQHLTLLVSALGGAFVMYGALTRLAPSLRWPCWCLALLYIACPGLMGLPYVTDMYPSFMTAPFLPLLLYGIIRSFQRPDFRSAALVAASLAILWMAHAPIALWCTALTGVGALVQAALVRRRLPAVRCWLLTGFLFAVLSAWYFVSVFSLGQNATYDLGKDFAANNGPPWSFLNPQFCEVVCATIRSTVPDAFLPVKDPPAGLGDLQLGYALWLVAGIGAVTACRRSAPLEQRTSAGLAVLVCLYLLPIPYVTEFLWRHLPRPFEINYFWPQERLYAVLAALVCFAGILAFRLFGLTSRASKGVLAAVLLVLCAWGLVEANKFRRRGKLIQIPTDPPTVLFAENAAVPGYAPRPDARPYNPDFSYDPVLENRLIAADGDKVAVIASNMDRALKSHSVPAASLMLRRLETKVRMNAASSYTNGRCSGAVPLFKLPIATGESWLLSFRFQTRNWHGHFMVSGPQFERIYWLPTNSEGYKMIQIPIWVSTRGRRVLSVDLVSDNRQMEAEPFVEVDLASWGMYSHDDLPVQVHSLVPYAATVHAARACALETHKLYYPGYEARVNGREAPVQRSPDGMVMVPLAEGANEVEVRYVGTPAMRAAFLVCAAAWLLLVGAAVVPFARKATARLLASVVGPRPTAEPVPAKAA